MNSPKIIDKKNIFNNLLQSEHIKLDLGCGNKKIAKDYLGLDLIDNQEVDIVGDILEILKLFPDNSVDRIYSNHCLEHLKNLSDVITECSRILKIKSKLEVIVPHFSNPYYYSDPTHKNYFGLYTFSYFAKNNLLKRKVPNYRLCSGLQVLSISLNFRSFRPRYITHFVKKIFKIIFNNSYFMQELYEENFSSIISCYEINFILEKFDE